ncbi:MAG TPA: DUF305 domain-containing protein [Terriglobales bacterium]|nr:DUF305 domain-containing protein [Terriglobales bacterium]
MDTEHRAMHENHYRHLGLMTALSFVSMYVLMYAMVNAFANVYNSVNQVYMAGLMTAPMVVIELVVMRGMYHDRRRNLIIMAIAAVAGIVCFALIRQQTAVSDRQFLRSMIPHHAGAILMCQEAPISDAEILKLCETITSGQQAEIDQMKRKLAELRD